MQDGPQRHIGIGTPLPAPQGIRQRLVRYPLAALQYQILDQRRRLAGLGKLGQHRMPIHQDLKGAQHLDFNACHWPSPPQRE